MKIKRFNNLWTMGLIIFGSLLAILYLAKIIFPSFVVGVAEMPSIVKFGTFVDSHWWSYHAFNFVISFITAYFYCCACCRKKKLNKKDVLTVIVGLLILILFELFLPQYYYGANMTILFALPTVMIYLAKQTEIKYLYSTFITFSVHFLAQMLSAEIRDISNMISYPNSATFFVLLIDGFIWLVLLYNYFNYKERV